MPVLNMIEPKTQSMLKRGEAIRIDRKTRWGNPFIIGKDGGRKDVIDKYRSYLSQRINKGEVTLEDLASLSGKNLACWCHPLPCHGDVLLKAADMAASKLRNQ